MGRLQANEALEEVDCTHCHKPMTGHVGSGGRERYYRCDTCMRWVSSTYAEVFQADTKFRARAFTDPAPGQGAFDDVKGKLERWLASVDDRDPYRLLGVSPLDPDDVVRQRFRDLAMQHHPDRGGAADKMRELNVAYERILRHRAERRAERLAQVPALPARAR